MKIGDVVRVMAAHKEENCGKLAIILDTRISQKRVFISVPATGASYWTYADWVDALEVDYECG